MNLNVRLRGAVACVSLACLLAASLAIRVAGQGSSISAAGVWRAEVAGRSWNAALRVDGDQLSGFVSSCASYPQDVAIADGRVEGATIRFTCKSPDGTSSLSLVGRVTGDVIAFSWQRSGDGVAVFDAPLFGPRAAATFTARRLPNRSPRNSTDVKLPPDVTFDKLRSAATSPQHWLTYSGNLQGHRYSALTDITRENVGNLSVAWVAQAVSTGGLRATPLVVNGVMYTTRNTNDVVALDATNGRVLWTSSYTPAKGARASGGGGRPNRGLAIAGSTLFLGTLDAHVVAIDAMTGKTVWDSTVADFKDPSCQGPGLGRVCYVITLAPLVIGDTVVVGLGGGDSEVAGAGIRGAIVAFDVKSGAEVWRFHTVPAPGDKGHATWAGDSWKTGGAGVWVTGSHDPDLGLTFWGTGNPSPPSVYGTPTAESRAGDNLFSSSVVALDATTGVLRWHYQFTPHDEMDWDAGQVPVLVDMPWHGRLRKVMLFANKNGLVYVLDRATGEFLAGTPFVDVDWMSGFDRTGRPLRINAESARISPASATNWYPGSYSAKTGLLYIPAWNRSRERQGSIVRGPAYGSIVGFDPRAGKKAWEFKLDGASFTGGVLTTASDVLFTGTSMDFYSDREDAQRFEGLVFALDARSGKELWKLGLPGPIQGPPITYSVNGKQYVVLSTNDTLFAFTVR